MLADSVAFEKVLRQLHGAYERERATGSNELFETDGSRHDGVVEHCACERGCELEAADLPVGYGDE